MRRVVSHAALMMLLEAPTAFLSIPTLFLSKGRTMSDSLPVCTTVVLTMLRLLSRSAYVTAAELARRLAAEGVSVQLRSLQRTLKIMSETPVYGVERNASTRPFGYRLAAPVTIASARLSPRDALLMRLSEESLAAGSFAEAESLFDQAVALDRESVGAHCGLWAARTENFTKTDAFYDETNALEAAQAPEEAREFLLSKTGERLREERAALEKETAPLRERVLAEREERRSAFRANRNYYLVRVLAFAATLLVALIGVAVSAAYIVRTTSILPIVLVGVFALVALVALIVALVFLRGLIVALRLCRENEDPASTEDGARLAEAELKLRCLADVLDGAQEE